MSRSVFITGGNRGIGLAIATAFAKDGDQVAIGYRSGSAPDGFLAVRCDVTEPDSLERALAAVADEQGPVEVLVANAGITRDKLALAMTDDDFTDVLDVNLVGAFRVARQVIPGMLSRRWGRLVFISSAVGPLGAAGQVNYTAAKTGMTGLARSLARELGTRGITVNVVAPGLIDTDMGATVTPARRDELVRLTALHRVGTPDEVAAVVRFLASTDAGYVTGAVLPVSGGLGMGS